MPPQLFSILSYFDVGHVGTIDEEGYLTIADRKKDIIVTAGGKNITPQYIENKLKSSLYGNDAVVIGDKRKFLSCLIIIDEDTVVKYAQDNKIQFSTYKDLTAHEEIKALIESEIKTVNESLSQVEKIKKFIILPKKLYEEDEEVTPTNEEFGYAAAMRFTATPCPQPKSHTRIPVQRIYLLELS
ncbi:hypothetical protein [Desulfobacula sp.]|uniref:hypothetical protein n=1 Tax=Desulfobacula sp. TaxID=2593537 RepID=UPI001ED628A1|nr:hypothetical protein [Desulfobacula sp.]